VVLDCRVKVDATDDGAKRYPPPSPRFIRGAIAGEFEVEVEELLLRPRGTAGAGKAAEGQ
jgi:hypothetical protein